MKRIKRFIYDLVNGIRSGIPLCCIAFFVLKSQTKNIGLTVYTERYEALDTQNTFSDPPSEKKLASYVQCDACWDKDRAVKIKKNGTVLKGFARSCFM